jgi:D-glycero-D-manno-heptose 1,7-bisphosphate phosphatase
MGRRRQPVISGTLQACIDKSMPKAVFLDRDGVINQAIVRQAKPYPPSNLSELVIPDMVRTVLRKLKESGYLLIVVTNQPDVARGLQTRERVEEINRILLQELPLDDIFTCYHDTEAGCLCRKPEPGLILQGAQRYQIDLSASYLVGDRWKDIEAGQRAGCRTIFVDYQYREKQPDNPDYQVTSLVEALSIILGPD